MTIGWKLNRDYVATVVGGLLMASVTRAQSPMVQSDLPSFGLMGIAPASQFVR